MTKNTKLWLITGMVVIILVVLGFVFWNKFYGLDMQQFEVNENDFEILGIKYTKIQTLDDGTFGNLELTVKTNKNNLIIFAFSNIEYNGIRQIVASKKTEEAGNYILNSRPGDPALMFTVKDVYKEHEITVCASSPADYSRGGAKVCKSIILPPYQE